MAYTQTDTAVLEIARVRPWLPEGSIVDVSYWDGVAWQSLMAGSVEVDLDFVMALAVTWENTGRGPARGLVGLSIIAPDATQVSLTATAGQEAEANPNEALMVEFEPFVLNLEGSYSGSITLEMERV